MLLPHPRNLRSSSLPPRWLELRLALAWLRSWDHVVPRLHLRVTKGKGVVAPGKGEEKVSGDGEKEMSEPKGDEGMNLRD